MRQELFEPVDEAAEKARASLAAYQQRGRLHGPHALLFSYCAVYALEQAYCHFSPALIDNLEHFWDAQNRKA